jgi:valyl-tRNA synthetase
METIKKITIPEKYNPEEIEIKWMNYWVDKKIFKFDENNFEKEIFSIDTPPPTVSGKLHIGHAFGNSQQDFIARYKRMSGFNVLQPLGTDDNGLPTKLLIEKLKKVKASAIGNDKFRELCIDTLNNELKPEYIGGWKRLGISCDYDIVYSTIDKHCQKISQKSFIDLYNMGREYRQESPTMFCPHCETAISQVECVDEEIKSHFNDIIFRVDEKDVIIATTRPELLPACVAVFYNPNDSRYKHLLGKMAKVPLFNFEVPILEDDKVSMDKGTGIVMCCTFGDQTDMEWQKKFKLPIKECFTKNGKMTSISGKYEGLPIIEGRKEIIKDLQQANLLKSSRQITHAVNVCERCGTPIEFIHSKQWFIRYLDLKDEMLEWGNELEWMPLFMKNRYDNWVKGLAWDWCISRQLPFGIPFPVWYCKKCDEVIIAKEENLPVDPNTNKCHLDKCPKCGCSEFIPEKDVLNTWATSSLLQQL